MNIGARIKAVRRSAGLSQEELARRASMSLKGVGDIERGDIEDPHYSSLSKIAEGLGVPIGALLEEPAAAGKAEAPAPLPPGPRAVVGMVRWETPAESVRHLAYGNTDDVRRLAESIPTSTNYEEWLEAARGLLEELESKDSSSLADKKAQRRLELFVGVLEDPEEADVFQDIAAVAVMAVSG